MISLSHLSGLGQIKHFAEKGHQFGQKVFALCKPNSLFRSKNLILNVLAPKNRPFVVTIFQESPFLT